MTPTKALLPALAAALAIGAGAMVATAQDDTAQDDTAQTPEAEAQTAHAKQGGRGDDHARRGGHRGGRNEGSRGSRHEGHHGGRHGGRGMMMQIFDRVDADGDGAVTQAEIDAYRAEQVSAADANGDGALAIEEFDVIYRALTRSRMVDAFQDLDEDGDGVVSPAEMDDRFGSIVERMDRNGDGALGVEDRGRGRRG